MKKIEDSMSPKNETFNNRFRSSWIYGLCMLRVMLSPILFQGIQPGGQLTITTEVENWPEKEILGPDLMKNMEDHARNLGCNNFRTCFKSSSYRTTFFVETDSGTQYLTESVILATGAQANWLGLDNEENIKALAFRCATCDGFFYREDSCGNRRRKYGC